MPADISRARRIPNPRILKVAPIAVTARELAEIDRRARAALLTRAEYMRQRALGHVCGPVKDAALAQADPPAAQPGPPPPATTSPGSAGAPPRELTVEYDPTDPPTS